MEGCLMKAGREVDHPAYLLLFDGVCHLCHGAVQFILKRDPHGHIHFASLQSQRAQEILSHYNYQEKDMSSVVFIANGQLYTKSDAILHVGRKLQGGWPLLSNVARLIPRPVRNPIYDWVARNRYRWMGKAEQCLLPTPQIRSRFLD
ncbi:MULTISPECIES: thiol-disulfide oxidoreductase DCC family protein [Brevibacillus]|uniref:thiol-disulfide oxidoreductase DCC family protein n=1 Tax=Brevibacillus TaxID=55080 RepID=UPI00115AD602|nr:thiol-disulfide oxidoreductase DCC family protein [Lysinibacillus sp. SDF0063]TQR38020.1 thiol-disulfide oxidoreductase DCC family protein [Lysinibacillus sp. SDF0063]